LRDLEKTERELRESLAAILRVEPLYEYREQHEEALRRMGPLRESVLAAKKRLEEP
jgi:hypothetical protein